MKTLTKNSRQGTRMHAAMWGMAVVASMATAPVSQAIELTLEPGNTSITVGSSVDLKLVIRGLGTGAAPSLGAFDLNLNFDPTVLSYDAVTFGDASLGNQLAFTTPSVDGDFVDASLGVLNLFSVSLDPEADLNDQQADSFVLANIRFLSLATGLSSVSLSDILLSDAAGGSLDASSVAGSQVEVVRGTVTVPEGGMFYPGLFLLAFSFGCARLRQRQA